MGIYVGQWVEISWVAIAASERAGNIPESTRQVPLVARVKGFALEQAEIGDEIEVLSLAGRRLRGRLVNASPRHNHSFGEPQPELLRVGSELRRELEA